MSLREPLISSLVFEITLVDRLHHVVKFWPVSPNSVASTISQNWKIIHLNCKEVRFRFDRSKKSYPNFEHNPSYSCNLQTFLFTSANFDSKKKKWSSSHVIHAPFQPYGHLNRYLYGKTFPLLPKNSTRANLPTILHLWVD